ncbi:MAG: class II aldolase/adducin family protein [Clostridia bacterium]|nr:class II aldolase/adducin family protein [Clostridia bacterium]
MAYNIQEAKELVVEAGKKLLETGLIARTWGNVSARISDTQFVITPSGRAYETLTPDDIVVVNIADCSYDGDIKPSSEKGVHADAYRLRPDENFVIHTHQIKASVVGAAGKNIDVPEKYSKLFGDCVPVADYGMPSTSKLRKAVETAYADYPNSKAILMKQHGAVVTGNSFEEAFEVVSELENLCEEKIQKAYMLYEGTPEYSYKGMLNSYIKSVGTGKMPKQIADFGESVRIGSKFEIHFKNGKSFTVDVKTAKTTSEEKLPAVAMIHSEIYKSSDVSYIKHLTASEMVAVSVAQNTILPRLDDFAQIAGTKIKSFKWDGSRAAAKMAAKAAKGNNAVLISGAGALCTGTKESDLDAVELIMSRECQTHIGSVFFGGGDSLSPLDANIMRIIYQTKYSKKAE